MKILVAGASGLVGKALTGYLEGKGHRAVKLSRQPGENTITWDPAAGKLDIGKLEDFDAFVNLAGENVAGRWSVGKKKAILETRVDSTRLLSDAILKLERPPKVWINASAIGFYGSQGDKIVDESSPQGTGFLADVCKQWEEAAFAARQKGVRVVLLRIGVVLSKKGGALANMLFPFKLGLGGRIGPGTQYMSWVSLNELVHMIDFAIRDELLDGPVNAVAPCPATNAEFTKAMGKALRRPTFFPLPAFAARLAFGEMADELLLSSTRVHPTKLQKAGYTYCDPSLEATLKKEFKS